MPVLIKFSKYQESIKLHPNALEKISNKIVGCLKNCVVKDGWPQYQSFSKHVNSLACEILKHKKDWLDEIDIYSIFYDLVYSAIQSSSKDNQNIEGSLWDILGEEESQKLADELKDYFDSIPRAFYIYIPLIGVSKDISSPIELCDEISIISFHDSSKIPGGYTENRLAKSLNKFELGKVYIKQLISGYAGNRLENKAVKKAFDNTRIILQQGISRNLFKLTKKRKPQSLGLLFSTFHQIEKSTIVIEDATSNNTNIFNIDLPIIFNIELPIDLCRFLSNIDINWESNSVKNAIENNELDKVIHAILKKPILLIECKDNEAERVKSAIKWRFDSYVTENKALEFLQVCIGLEALLGDDTSNGGLTETLADRCSYLIGDNIKGRIAIKDKFKYLYKERSKLVHGVVSELNNNTSSLDWGRTILDIAILKEMKHLNLM